MNRSVCVCGGGGGDRMEFLNSAYMESRYEVRVGEILRESFGVVNGLRQGCVLSPVLFSLYINSLLDKLRKAEVGVKCKDQLISWLYYRSYPLK